MKKCSLIFLFISLLAATQLLAQHTTQDTLPDDHLLFTMRISNDRLEGTNEYLEGFKISLALPDEFVRETLDKSSLISLVRDREITGTLTYPNGKTTQIKYEVVRHRETEDIYMKTTLGYFLWESVTISGDILSFVIYWWYCPPARKVDLETLEMAEQLLGDSINWHKNDDRKCDADIESNKWSLFCALKYASIEIMGEYNHHNTAMQTVRFVIDELIPHHEYEHTLMDYNNSPSTNHDDILHVIAVAKKRIKQDLDRKQKREEI